MKSDSEPDMTICDRCSVEIEIDSAQTGSPGTEYEGCTLCDDCAAENNEASP